MRLLVDYRPALRARTGVGEWIHQLVRAALTCRQGRAGAGVDLTVFVSSWKDRPSPAALAELPGARLLDRRIPVRVLSRAWNRWSFPPVDWLAGRSFDATFSPTPLLVPTTAPVTVVTVHDFDFLDHPERTWAEMRDDFPARIARHVSRATLVAAISRFTAAEATRRLNIPPEKLVVCRPGVPDWIRTLGATPAHNLHGYILFMGTLEPRKNAAGLVRAYARLRNRRPAVPSLVLAGGHPPHPDPELARLLDGPASAGVERTGYVAPDARPALYAGASLLVLPSHMEGFGIPALEAMALGVPVIVSDKGALPEVAGDAGLIVPDNDDDALAEAMDRVLTHEGLAAHMRERGLARAADFSWDVSANRLLDRIEDVHARGGRS